MVAAKAAKSDDINRLDRSSVNLLESDHYCAVRQTLWDLTYLSPRSPLPEVLRLSNGAAAAARVHPDAGVRILCGAFDVVPRMLQLLRADLGHLRRLSVDAAIAALPQ